jgi:hypothetical protein
MLKDNINLNLIFDYPVKWGRTQILREFVQNFYDSIGLEKWSDGFKYEIANGQLTMFSEDASYNYEWLVHVGASTKREKNRKYAGYFGEGFKMAALCAVRDMKWGVEAASRRWRLVVTTRNITVDGRELQSLAYEIYETEEFLNGARIAVKNFGEEDGRIFQAVIKRFYYPQNPLLGEPIFKNHKYKIFHRSAVEKPEFYSVLIDTKGEGILFCDYQLRAFIDAPLVVCVNGCDKLDRDRPPLLEGEALEILLEAAKCTSASAAYEVLAAIRKKWRYLNAARKHSYWPHIIEELVDNIQPCGALKKRFRKEFKKIYAMEPLDPEDFRSSYKRRVAIEWHKQNKPDYDLVVSEFEPLGIKLLENACEAAGGYPAVRKPNKSERIKITKLVKAARKLLPPCFISSNISSCEVFDDQAGAALGLAILSRHRGDILTKYLVEIERKKICRECKEKICGFNSISKYELEGIELNSRLLAAGRDLSGALAVYIHELAHIYGEDGSGKFGRALERAILAIIDRA